MEVIAKTRGYYDRKVREEGEAFSLSDSAHFSEKWMTAKEATLPITNPPPDQDSEPAKRRGRPPKQEA